MHKYGQIEIASKKFNSEYQIIITIDLNKIRLSEGVVTNKHDTRYTIGYEVEPGKIIPLYIKTPKNCASSGVIRYNESSTWKIGFNVNEDENWVKQYDAVWWRICELLRAPGCGGLELSEKLTGSPLSNGKFINPKLITWDGEIKTKFIGKLLCKPEDLGACYVTGILKIGSVYRQGANY